MNSESPRGRQVDERGHGPVAHGVWATLIIVAACGGNPDPDLVARAERDPCAGAWVQLFENARFSGRTLTIAYPTGVSNLRVADAGSDAGSLNDAASSARWSIPSGCRLILYADERERGTQLPLVGSGRLEENANLGTFNDQASSAAWERS